MRIGVIQPTFSDVGGTERMAYLMATELNARIFTSGVRSDIESYFPGISSKIVNLQDNSRGKFNVLSYVKNLAKVINSVDILVFITPRSILLKELLKKIPYLYYVTTPKRSVYVAFDHIWQQTNMIGKVRLATNRVLQDITWKQYVKHRVKGDRVVTISKTTYDRYKSVVSKIPRKFIYPPVDVSRYSNKPSEDFYLSVNRLYPLKGIDIQLRAFKESKENLIIVGDGPLYDAINGKIRKWNATNIQVIGNVKELELLDLYSRCKALIYSTYHCEFGLVCIEAMSSGKPVLAIKQGAPTEYIESDTNGWLFENVSELKQLINSTKIEKMEEMKNDCLRTARKFDIIPWKSEVAQTVRNILTKEYAHK